MGYGILEFSGSEVHYGISIVLDEQLHFKVSSGIKENAHLTKIVLIAIDGDINPVGCLTWTPESNCANLNVFVKPDFRNKGIGTLLVKSFKDTSFYNKDTITIDNSNHKNKFWSKAL